MLENILACALVIGGAFSARTPRELPNLIDFEVSGIWRAESDSKLVTYLIVEENYKPAKDIDRQTASLVYPVSLGDFKFKPGIALTTEKYDMSKAEGKGVARLSYKDILYVKAVGTDVLEYVEAGVDWKIPMGDRVNLVPMLSYYYEPVNGEEAKEAIQVKITVEFDVLFKGEE